MPNLYAIPGSHVAPFWPRVRKLLTAALERTGLSDPAELERDALAGRYQLWIALADDKEIAAAWLTHILTIGARRVLHFAAAGGDFKSCAELHGEFERYARLNGCTSIRIVGRKGWQRVLPGYTIKNVILEKAL